MLIVQSLAQHWPARKIEWIMAGLMSTWGGYVLLHPSLFTDERTAQLFSGIAAISNPILDNPALAWGGAALFAGLIRGIALFVNGAYTRTPLIRLVTSFLSMFIFTQVSIGLWESGLPNTGLVVYPWLVVADLLSTYRAAQDAVYAEKMRRDKKDSRRGARDSSFFPA